MFSGRLFAQDTVCVGDPRYLFSNINDSTYFSHRYANHGLYYFLNHHATRPDSVTRTLHSLTYATEHNVGEKGIILYGIAISMTYDYSQNRFTWNHWSDTVWLKVSHDLNFGYFSGRPAMDSVRISLWSEQKTLVLDGFYRFRGSYDPDTLPPGAPDPFRIRFDSVIHDTLPLYCGYFDRPLHISDTSFFTSLELVAQFESFGSRESSSPYPGVYVAEAFINNRIGYYGRTSYAPDTIVGGLGWYWHEDDYWPVIIPIVAPQDNSYDPETPDSLETMGQVETTKLTVSPNPAQTYTTVLCDQPIDWLCVCDLTGRTLTTIKNCGTSARLDISSFPKGLYVVKVQTASAEIVRKLLVR